MFNGVENHADNVLAIEGLVLQPELFMCFHLQF